MSDDKLSRKTKILNILSFGLLKAKAKKQAKLNKQNEAKIEISFSLQEFYSVIGGKENLINFQLVSDNSLKLYLLKVAEVKIDDVKAITNAIGTVKANDSLLILTKQAKGIFELLKNEN